MRVVLHEVDPHLALRGLYPEAPAFWEDVGHWYSPYVIDFVGKLPNARLEPRGHVCHLKPRAGPYESARTSLARHYAAPVALVTNHLMVILLSQTVLFARFFVQKCKVFCAKMASEMHYGNVLTHYGNVLTHYGTFLEPLVNFC